jgi:hypothetical protein
MIKHFWLPLKFIIHHGDQKTLIATYFDYLDGDWKFSFTN